MERIGFSTPRGRWIAVGICAALLLIFALLSASAARSKSATYDETLHCVAGFVHRTLGDFRINPEDPALFGYWGSLAHGSSDLKLNKDLASWDAMLDDFATHQWVFSIQTLYQTSGNDGDAFLQRSRLMFTLVGVGLGIVIASWAWRIAGPVAGVFALALFCFDPNFAAHASLFKNDVMLSLMMAGLSMALWRFGQRGTIASLVAIALTAAAAINVKFSGILCGPMILLVLLIRALMREPWPMLRWTLSSRWQRCGVVLMVCAITALSAYALTWTIYRFRYLPSDDPNAHLNVKAVVDRARMSRARAMLGEGDQHTVEETQQLALHTPVPMLVRTLTWAMDHRVLPQSWLFGFLFTYATTQIRSSFLLGSIRLTGWWYYFPCTILFKTPTATLAAIALIPACVWWRRNTSLAVVEKDQSSTSVKRTEVSTLPRFWSLICLGIPAAVYAGSAMSTNLNLGLRHILPIYPFIFIALGVGLTQLLRRHWQTGVILGGILVGSLAIESLASYPNYLAFFNFPSGGSAGGMDKLGDSNLDWGQDLKGLAQWRTANSKLPMYLAYFGTASPRFYGVDAINLPYAMGGWPFDPNPQMPQQPCYLAISATNLQGIYLGNSKMYDSLREADPIAVIGGSIYIYQLPLSRHAN